jgi:hypothetical protein
MEANHYEVALDKIIHHVSQQYQLCRTEEATKTALILPFLYYVLGYDVWNAQEVVPEFVADVGIKKGERVDYAIFQNGIPVILFECKPVGASLAAEHATQLLRYFNTTPQAKIGILTDGVRYRFFTDTEAPNMMDAMPFFEFSLLNFDKPSMLDELRNFTKSVFNPDDITKIAVQLKYAEQIRAYLSMQVTNPSDEFVKFMALMTKTKLTTKNAEQFRSVVRRGVENTIATKAREVAKMFEIAKANGIPESAVAEGAGQDAVIQSKNIVTTADELEAYYIIKSILREHVLPERVTYRDLVNYFDVNIDNNPRKLIARMYFNKEPKVVGVVTATGEVKTELQSLQDLYKHVDNYLYALNVYEQKFQVQRAMEE